MTSIQIIQPQQFEVEKHYYTKVINSQIHPTVSYFLNLPAESILTRYLHLYPKVNRQKLEELLQYQPQHFRWAGNDLFKVTNSVGQYQMVVVETNSCPSGQKSMPLRVEHDELGAYKLLIQESFLNYLDKKTIEQGQFAVLYDKNLMGSSGYAATLATLLGRPVYFVEYKKLGENVSFEDGYLYIHHEGQKIKIDAAFRYVTQKPWNRIPVYSKTKILNPPVACLAGGRNKLIAAKAYELFNSEYAPFGLKIITPETYWNVSKAEVPFWIQKLGGQAVVKVPYSNAGQGVYTITQQSELDEFMAVDFDYDQFIVQSLIGNYNWSSHSQKGRFYHVGTIPNKKNNIYVADLRMMVSATKNGFQPLALYCRRAKDPLCEELTPQMRTWDILGTNLSIKKEDGWDSDTARLLLMDRRDFNRLGFGIDDLIEAYIQTIMCVKAIDSMAQSLYTKKGKFRKKYFQSMNPDPGLINEIYYGDENL